MNCSTPHLPVYHQLPKFTQTHVHWVGDAIQPTHHLFSPFPPASSFPNIRVFSNELALHIRWPNYWTFSFSISPCYEYSGLISFRIDWFDIPAVQGTSPASPRLFSKSLLQHYSSKALILWHSAFQLSHWITVPFSRGYSQSRGWTQLSCIAGGFFTIWTTRDAQEYWNGYPIPSPADLPYLGIKLGSFALQVDSLQLSHHGSHPEHNNT